jgi:hypothetical protein
VPLYHFKGVNALPKVEGTEIKEGDASVKGDDPTFSSSHTTLSQGSHLLLQFPITRI